MLLHSVCGSPQYNVLYNVYYGRETCTGVHAYPPAPLGAFKRGVSFLSADVLSVFSPMSYQQMSMFKCQM